METLYGLREITLLPTRQNKGHLTGERYSVVDKMDGTESFPIFTSPMESIVGKETVKTYVDHGIRPILPLTEPLPLRIEWSQWIFCAFSIAEVKQNFLLQDKRSTRSQYHICIDSGNGQDIQLLEIGKKVKNLYGDQVILMGGNLGTPEVYVDYCRAGFDYVRVGMNSSSIVNKNKYGFYYPMASLLLGIKNIKKSAAVGLPKITKIVADGGIEQQSDVLKAIALGADYVMIGREFSRLLEAQGTIYKRERGKSGKMELIEVSSDRYSNLSGLQLKGEVLKRFYYGNTHSECRYKRAGFLSLEDWKKTKPSVKVMDSSYEDIDIDCTINEWIDDFQNCVYYGFMMTGVLCWEDFQKEAKYALLGGIYEK